MKSFVLVYRRDTGELTVEEFAPGRRVMAFARRSALQRTTHPNTEVVVLHATHVDDLRITHRRYFEGAGEMLRHMTA